LSSKNVCKTNRITQLKISGQEISTPGEIAETFNSYFSNIGEKLASEIPPSEHEPSFYLKPTDKSFSLQAPQVDTVCQLLSGIDEKKSEGLDNIPNKLLKIAATVIAPSLTGIFAASIRTGIFPYEWKAESKAESKMQNLKWFNISIHGIVSNSPMQQGSMLAPGLAAPSCPYSFRHRTVNSH
jgi:hypothetical protein